MAKRSSSGSSVPRDNEHSGKEAGLGINPSETKVGDTVLVDRDSFIPQMSVNKMKGKVMRVLEGGAIIAPYDDNWTRMAKASSTYSDEDTKVWIQK